RCRLLLRRRLVDATLAAQLELEVLDRVGDVDLAARDAELLERAGEKLPGRTDEGTALQILLVARLLAHEHQPGAAAAFAADRLRRVLADRALAASLQGGVEGGQAARLLASRRHRMARGR